ncbi:hypothetical protein J6590_008800 [Homalodisca vitripennis]|nr:hypothetical protein J6590_008800 [Homalodisca vitripennis]
MASERRLHWRKHKKYILEQWYGIGEKVRTFSITVSYVGVNVGITSGLQKSQIVKVVVHRDPRQRSLLDLRNTVAEKARFIILSQLMMLQSLEPPAVTPQLLLHSGCADRVAILTSRVYHILSRTVWDQK